MRLHFIRHGQTDYNVKKIVQGGGIDSNINQKGIQQAEAFYRAYQHMDFDAVYASPLKRTHQTLAPWKAKGYDFKIEAGLKEFNWGVYEGKKPGAEERAAYLDVIDRWAKGDYHARVEGGETLGEAWQRAENFFQNIHTHHEQENILLCSHGRQLRILLVHILGVEPKEMERFSHDNTGFTIIDWQKGTKPELVQLNDTQHLKALYV